MSPTSQKLRLPLFDGSLTPSQLLLIGGWALLLLGVVTVWLSAPSNSFASLSESLVSLGRLAGLLATFFALTQFILMSRSSWLERSFGLDRLASYHRINGYLAISLILLHPALVVNGYAMAAGVDFLSQQKEVVTTYPFVWLAAIAQILFITVVVSSIYIVRKRLKFESWYFVHLIAYGAIVLVPLHQLVIGSSLAGNPLATAYWLFLYGSVGVSLAIWRFGIPTINTLRYKFSVTRVVRETDDTVSIYIGGKDLKRLPAQPGQFVLVRFLVGGLWWQEHPFSISQVPFKNDEMRLTVKSVGDYTATVPKLKTGTRVVVSGPYGRFTSDVAQTGKRLFLAGGVGITPLRTLAEESVKNNQDSTLLYATKNKDSIIFKKELEILSKNGLRSVFIFSESGKPKGYIDEKLISSQVPDILDRDIYLCGPPAMMSGLIPILRKMGVSDERLHYERFSLHAAG